MLDGLMRLDFNPFRRVPFDECTLTFTSDHAISVKPMGKQEVRGLEVSYRNIEVVLNPVSPGALRSRDASKVEQFRQRFFEDMRPISFEFIDTERLRHLAILQGEEQIAAAAGYQILHGSYGVAYPDVPSMDQSTSPAAIRRIARNPKAKGPPSVQSLAGRVGDFVRDAQVNYRNFFATTTPDVFDRVIERLTTREQPTYKAGELRRRLEAILEQNKTATRFGLEMERWDYKQLIRRLRSLSARRGAARDQGLAVLAAYVEMLEARAAQTELVADRLLTFERLLEGFFVDKHVKVEGRDGLKIVNERGEPLSERQLSSGEYQLLFLMVAALVTRRRGTVIAIDEPEMSMHIAWQRKLVGALVECASKAEPLFILATHSPDIAASFPDAMVELS
jgi:hypothetical protein